MRWLPYIALSIVLLVTLTQTKEQSTASSQPNPLPTQPDGDAVKLLILDVKQEKQLKNPYFSTKIEVKVKVLNHAYSEKRDLLLLLRIRETKGDVIAALSMLIYVPVSSERTYTTQLLVRNSGLMVVEASLHRSDEMLAKDRYYIDITPFDLI